MEPIPAPCHVCKVFWPAELPRRPHRPRVCDSCRRRLVDGVGELFDLVPELDPTPGAAAGEKVSGSREAPAAARIAVLSATGPGSSSVHDEHGDQVGLLPVAVWLWEWIDCWGGVSAPHLENACDAGQDDAAVADFAAELVAQLGELRALTGVAPPRPVLKVGVPCRECDTKALYQAPGDEWIRCRACPQVYSPSEYQQWTSDLTGAAGGDPA